MNHQKVNCLFFILLLLSLIKGADRTAVVFVVDNSGSNTKNDRDGVRLTITSSIIDSIYKRNPKTKVGIVVFGTHLWFDPQHDDIFENVTESNQVLQL